MAILIIRCLDGMRLSTVNQTFNFLEIISYLKESKLVSRVEIKTIDEVHESGIYKIRCRLIPSL